MSGNGRSLRRPNGAIMDLLRFLVALPALLLSRVFVVLRIIFEPLFGAVSWSPPPWMFTFAAELRRRAREYAGGALAAVVLVVLGWFGWQWYLHLPRPPEPDRITIEAVAPAITSYERPDGAPALVIHPLDVKFSGSAAPIEKVGKSVSRGITMDPELKGTWKWTDDRT